MKATLTLLILLAGTILLAQTPDTLYITLPDYVHHISIQTDHGIATGKKDRAKFGKKTYLACIACTMYTKRGAIIRNNEYKSIKKKLYGYPADWVKFVGFELSGIDVEYSTGIGVLPMLIAGKKPLLQYERIPGKNQQTQDAE
ncbi:MAG: hypothetical protein NC115_02155 [Bacteroidales bacterium]|nr:hypothetical protein [Bacteroidales bacterium]